MSAFTGMSVDECVFSRNSLSTCSLSHLLAVLFEDRCCYDNTAKGGNVCWGVEYVNYHRYTRVFTGGFPPADPLGSESDSPGLARSLGRAHRGLLCLRGNL